MKKNEMLINCFPLETERLIINKTTVKDIEMILKMDKQEITQKYLGGIKNKTRDERIKFLEKKENKFKDGIASSLTVYLKDEFIPIGFVELNVDENNNSAEISYIFDYDYCNKGYCTESLKKLLEIGFLKLELNRICADVIKGNESSKRVLEKLNFKHEGTRRKAVFVNTTGEYSDFLDFGLLSDEYKNRL